jgi:hypothetical protein
MHPNTLPPRCFSSPTNPLFQHQPGTISLVTSHSQAHPFPPKYCSIWRISEHYIHLYTASGALLQAKSNIEDNQFCIEHPAANFSNSPHTPATPTTLATPTPPVCRSSPNFLLSPPNEF